MLTQDQLSKAAAGMSSSTSSLPPPSYASPQGGLTGDALDNYVKGTAPTQTTQQQNDTRNPFQKAVGAFVDPIATEAERSGEAIGSLGLKGADALTGGAVNNWYKQNMGYTLDEGLDKATSQPSTIPVLGTHIQPSNQDTAEQVAGRAASTVALGVKSIPLAGGLFGGGAAMNDNKGAGEVTADAIGTALASKVLEYGFNAVSPFIAKAVEKFGKPVAEKIASVVPESYKASFNDFTDKAHTALGGDAAATEAAPATEPSIIDKTNDAVSSAVNASFKAVEDKAAQVGSAAKSGAADILSGIKSKVSEGNLGDALPSAITRLADTAPEVAVGARSNNPLDLYNEFHDQEQKFKIDNKEDTALGVVGSRIGKNFNKVAAMRRAEGATMGSEMEKIGSTPTDIEKHFPALEAELKKNGVSFDADLGKILGSRTSKMTADDKSFLEDYTNQLNELGPKPTAAELDAFLSRVPKELDAYKSKNSITKTTNGERIVRAHLDALSGELSAKTNPAFKGFADAKKNYGALSNFLGEGEKYLGKKTQTGDYTHDASLAKSSVQSLLNNGKKDWLIKLEALTGYKGLDEATLATQAMKDAGNFRGNSLLELLSPDGPKIPLTKHGAIMHGVDAGVKAAQKKLIGTPADQTRRVIQELLDKAKGSEGFSAGAVPETAPLKVNPSFTGEDAAVHKASIEKYNADPIGMLQQYLKENGNVVNTDNARSLFSDVGYEGHNSAAVHDASKAISDSAFAHLLGKSKPGQEAYFMAGGSGAGKSTATKSMADNMNRAAVVFDGNLSKYGSAMKKISEATEKGLNPSVPYVYRDAQQAWGSVIDRMLGDGPDKGRVVPLTNFLENTHGSLDVAKKMYNNGVPVFPYDNSFGPGASKPLSGNQIHGLAHPEGLEKTLVDATEARAAKGELSAKQYEGLLHGLPHTPFNDLH